MKLITAIAVCLAMACTFVVDVPSIKPKAAKQYNISKAFRSIGMLALRPVNTNKVLGIGTAFAIDKNKLLSASHVCGAIGDLAIRGVIDKEIYLVVLGRSDKLIRKVGAKIKSVDIKNDICELELKGHGLEPLKIADYRTVKFNDPAYIVGAPAGVMASIGVGRVMQRRSRGLGDPNSNGKLIVSSPATGGNSGSPILNDRGEVIGMLILGHPNFPHLSLGVTGPVLKKFMRRNKIRFRI